jgi:spermidine synthase
MIKFTEIAPFVAVEYSYDVEKVLYKAKSQYQDIMVFENPYFGNMLVLDGIVQLTERDEFFYHEMLAQVSLHAHPEPKTVVVIGGGDGGTVREVMKHSSVEKCYFIEIDRKVIEVSKEFFPSVSKSVDDPRVEIRNMDGAEFIKGRNGDVDVILVDSTDPIGFARTLFSEEFFTSCAAALKKDGLFVTHADSLLLHSDMVREVQLTMRKAFPLVDLYTGPIATYPGNWWAYNIGSRGLDPKEMRRELAAEFRYYDEEIHPHAFLPRKLYKRLLDGKLNW